MTRKPVFSLGNIITDRRDVLRSATGATLGVTAALHGRSRSVHGANDRIGIGFIGVGGRRNSLMRCVRGLIEDGENIQIVAVNDTYGPRMRDAAEKAKARAFRRHQDLLSDADVDIASRPPDRLHLPQAMDAIQAG